VIRSTEKVQTCWRNHATTEIKNRKNKIENTAFHISPIISHRKNKM
jgi:hypothetical protein